MSTLFIVRHGQTQWNVEQRMQGRLDSALTEVGKAQAIRHGQLLKSLGGVDQMYVSPSGRTQETAFLLNSFLGARISNDEVLMERDCGIWSGMTVSEIKSRFPQEWESRLRDPYSHRPPGGENTKDLVDRIAGFLDQVLGEPSERIALVTHGVMSRAILTHLLELTPQLSGQLRHPNNAVYQLEILDRGMQTSHYVDGEGPVTGLLHNPVGASA